MSKMGLAQLLAGEIVKLFGESLKLQVPSSHSNIVDGQIETGYGKNLEDIWVTRSQASSDGVRRMKVQRL
jgi:hypothetical protein